MNEHAEAETVLGELWREYLALFRLTGFKPNTVTVPRRMYLILSSYSRCPFTYKGRFSGAISGDNTASSIFGMRVIWSDEDRCRVLYERACGADAPSKI